LNLTGAIIVEKISAKTDIIILEPSIPPLSIQTTEIPINEITIIGIINGSIILLNLME
jgi:hypothetical protein